MKRLFVAGVLLVLLSLTIPALRERAMPKYRAAGTWVWGVVDGPLTPVLTPYRRLQTQSEMAEIKRELINRRNRGFPPPAPQDLPAFLGSVRLDSTATDKWGTPYYLMFQPDSIYLRSAGPDKEHQTDDDIVEAIRYRNYMGRARPR